MDTRPQPESLLPRVLSADLDRLSALVRNARRRLRASPLRARS